MCTIPLIVSIWGGGGRSCHELGLRAKKNHDRFSLKNSGSIKTEKLYGRMFYCTNAATTRQLFEVLSARPVTSKEFSVQER
jgi:hypothetical protein